MPTNQQKINENSLPNPVCDEHHHALPLPDISLEVPAAQRMAEFFAVLGDPNRLRLISILADKEHCVCDLAQALGVTDSAVSHQLRTLRSHRLVAYRKVGRQVYYRLHDHHVIELYHTVREHLDEPNAS